MDRNINEIIKTKYSVVETKDKIYIEDVSIDLGSYEAKIISCENVNGIAKCYDIGSDYIVFNKGGSSLSEYVKNNKLSKMDLINFIEDIYKAEKTIEDYLMPQDVILMGLDTIIINEHHIEFVAVPNIQLDFMLELSRFLIKILRYVDVNDKEALSLAYTLFVRSSKDDYELEDLLEVVKAEKTS